jgi:sugar transferase (PEP-CTERM/EpsH1 system associated)
MNELLFLAHRAPFPPDRGDKIRSYHVLRHLAARARVHLIAFAEDPADRLIPDDLRAQLASATIVPRTKSRGLAAIEALARGRPVSLTAFADPAMTRAVARALATNPIKTIYCFSGQMAQYLPVDGPPVIMDFVDVDSAKFGGFSDRGPLVLRWLMRREARLLGAFERAVSSRVAASLFVSEAEAQLYRDGGGQGAVLTVENGIDARIFDPAIVTPVDQAGPLIVFTGQMDYRPNIDAVIWFASEVLPRIRQSHAQACFAVVGRAPSAAVMALAGPNVIVTGAVDDVRGWLAAADVCVAPLHLARGIQNKVLEAMAMARPVVASPAAAEGIDHDGALRVADGAAAMAEAVVALLEDRDQASALGLAARRRVIDRYDWDARLASLGALTGLAG